ncbi:TPA: hypothetical protein ACH3X3_003895 [Trebouxia sp. C0006]
MPHHHLHAASSCIGSPSPRQLLPKEDWPHEDEVEDQLEAMCMVAQLMNVMVCYKRLQSGEEASQKIRAFISRTLKPRTCDIRPMQDTGTGNSPADGATPSSPRAGVNSLKFGIAHDSHYPVTDAKPPADSSTFDSDPASATPVGATSGTHACNSSTGSTKSPSLEPAASNPESVVSPRVKAAAIKDTCCPPEATGSSVRQDPLQSGPERKAASSAVAPATAEEHVHLAMIALSALQWIPHQPRTLKGSMAASTPAIFQLLHDLLLQDLLHPWLDRLARDIPLQREDVLLSEDGRLEEALAWLMVPLAKQGDDALPLSLMRLDALYLLLVNVKVAASVAAKYMAGVHKCFKHYASPHGTKAERFTVGAILAQLLGKEVQAAVAEVSHLCGKREPPCGMSMRAERERFASEWLASQLDLVYERDLREHILGLTGAIMLVKSMTSVPEVLDGLMSSMLTLLNLMILSQGGKEHVQEVLGKDGPVLLDRFRVNLPFLKGSTKLTLPPHQQAGISTGAQIEAVPVSLFHCLLSLMSTLEKGRSKDAEDFQTVLPGMMACFWDAVCSASKVVDKQRADVSTGAAVDGLEETVDLIVFLDLLVVFHERTEWKLMYAGPPTPADVVKTILHLLYNLAAELTFTVIACKAAEVLLMTNRQEKQHNRQERSNHLKMQLGKALQSAATLQRSPLWQPYFAETRIAARQWCKVQLHLTGHMKTLSSDWVTMEMSDLAAEQLLAEEQAAHARADAKKAKKLRQKQKRKQAQQLTRHDEDEANISSSAEPSQALLSLSSAAQPDQQLSQQLQGGKGAVQSAQQEGDTDPCTSAHDQLEGHYEEVEERCERREGHHEEVEGHGEEVEGHYEQLEGRWEQSEGHHQRLEGNHEQLEGHCKPQVGRHARGQSKGQEPGGPGPTAASILHHSGVPAETHTHNQTLCHLFCCPLTKVRMQDPVIAADGHTYERQAMEDWLTCHSTSPVTGQKLHSLRLISNVAIRCAIRDQVLTAHLPE